MCWLRAGRYGSGMQGRDTLKPSWNKQPFHLVPRSHSKGFPPTLSVRASHRTRSKMVASKREGRERENRGDGRALGLNTVVQNR